MVLTVDEGNYANLGDMLLFSDVLSRVMSMYVPMNTLFNLRVIGKKKGEIFECPMNGTQGLI